MGPCIIVFPDCFTCLGGNQYINSSAIGRYADYLTRELIPFVDREFRTLASRDHRGCFGKSSGGYGAIIHGMKYAKYWGAIAESFGRRVFRLLLPHGLAAHAERARPLSAARAGSRAGIDVVKDAAGTGEGYDDGRVRRFLDAIWSKEKLNDAEGARADGDRDGRVLRSGPRRRRWAFGCRSTSKPASCFRRAGSSGRSTTRSISSAATRDNLRTLRGIYIDCGWRDQYHLHFGARILSRAARRCTASSTRTRSSTTRIRRSTTGWTSACRFSTGR